MKPIISLHPYTDISLLLPRDLADRRKGHSAVVPHHLQTGSTSLTLVWETAELESLVCSADSASPKKRVQCLPLREALSL